MPNNQLDADVSNWKNKREQIRDLLLYTMIVVTCPIWLSVYVKVFAPPTAAAMLSLVPGLLGLWLRRSFYYMTLNHAPTDVSIEFGSRLLGRNVRLEPGVWVGNWSTINDCSIGNGTIIGSYVDIFSGAHQHGTNESLSAKKSETPMALPEKLITIGENVWIGSGATVFADIGNNSIIGAGSVVVKPIPANCIAAGNPAKVLKMAKII